MRIPRDVSGEELVKMLRPSGYEVTRQVGSHIRLTTTMLGEHHITIFNHNPVKVGTLSAILSKISEYHGMSKSELHEILFG